MSMTATTRSAQRAEAIVNTKPLLFGVLALAFLVVLLRTYEQAFGWTAGLDSFAPEFQIYWARLLQGAIVLNVFGGAALIGYLWRTRDRNMSQLLPAAEMRRYVYLVQWLTIFSLAMFFGLSFFSEQTAVWHMTAIRDTDFTPSNIITFYISYPLFAVIGMGAFFYARTRLPYFAKGFSLAFTVLVVGVFMTIPNVGFNEWGHTSWSMDEGFASPLHWGFVFFGWMSLAIFGVVLQILGRLRELFGNDGLLAIRR
ncbi:MAG: methane monooxygenase/ammonia monooxygenase subunit C [Alphaproteobacteria bacterium]|nr:methane monooxygenase/ammonia monooxygenase subunit C [Alphaproteobacteria bacterium]